MWGWSGCAAQPNALNIYVEDNLTCSAPGEAAFTARFGPVEEKQASPLGCSALQSQLKFEPWTNRAGQPQQKLSPLPQDRCQTSTTEKPELTKQGQDFQ